MPYVDPADALNAAVTTIPMEPLTDGEAFSRAALVANASMRLVQLTFPANFRTIPHYHPRAGELFLIVAGSAEFRFDAEPPIEAVPGQLLYAAPGVVHEIGAGPAGVRFLAGVGPNEDAPDEQVEVDPIRPASVQPGR